VRGPRNLADGGYQVGTVAVADGEQSSSGTATLSRPILPAEYERLKRVSPVMGLLGLGTAKMALGLVRELPPARQR
jgi:hypothetical protein